MKTIIHIEDRAEWLEKVRNALALSLDLKLEEPITCLQEFRDRNQPYADLYICDRHIPERKDGRLDDESWKAILSCVECIYPESKIIVLSKKSLDNYVRYSQVVKSIKKDDFTPETFRAEIEKILGLQIGIVDEHLAGGYRK